MEMMLVAKIREELHHRHTRLDTTATPYAVSDTDMGFALRFDERVIRFS